MKNLRITRLLALVACLAVFALPVLNSLLIAPSFSEFLKLVAEKELVKIASHMTKLIAYDEDLTSTTLFSPEVLQQIEEERKLLDLVKIKIFTRSGRIIYSTDTQEIGNPTGKTFFQDLIASQKTRSALKIIDPKNSGNKTYLVETYVPIFKDKRVIGVFEIYYDTTETRKNLALVTTTINWIVTGVSLLLLLAVLGSAYLSRRSHLQQEKIEAEKDTLIEELSRALKEIKTLQGILPLCCFCKKIRNDSGYWEQVDVYIDQHSDADISHGICPDCVKEQYPDDYEEILATIDKDQ